MVGPSLRDHLLLVRVRKTSVVSRAHEYIASVLMLTGRWTSFPKISFWVPMMSGFVMGCTLLLLTVRSIPLLQSGAAILKRAHLAGRHVQLHCRYVLSACSQAQAVTNALSADVYSFAAASALSSCTVIRSVLGAVFPVSLFLMTSIAMASCPGSSSRHRCSGPSTRGGRRPSLVVSRLSRSLFLLS